MTDCYAPRSRPTAVRWSRASATGCWPASPRPASGGSCGRHPAGGRRPHPASSRASPGPASGPLRRRRHRGRGRDCFGTPVIEAARLCAAAERGRILAAEVVRLLARGRGPRVHRRGELELKGLPEPVARFRVGWQREPPAPRPCPSRASRGRSAGSISPGRAPSSSRWPPLGRRPPPVSAGERVGGWRAGYGQDPPGRRARPPCPRGGRVGALRPLRGGPRRPLRALRRSPHFFSQHIRADELPLRLGRYPGELGRLFPELGDLVPGLDLPLRSDPETEQYRLFEAVASWLAAAGEAPACCWWSTIFTGRPHPRSSCSPMCSGGGPARLLVVGTFRDTEVGPSHPLSACWPTCGARRGGTHLPRRDSASTSCPSLMQDVPRRQSGRALAAAPRGDGGEPVLRGGDSPSHRRIGPGGGPCPSPKAFGR